jgi:hypothetical protein
MQIVDQTPYRAETGEITTLGRIQGTFKYGLGWFDGLKAQDAVIAILNKQLDKSFIMLRNVTLPEIEVTLPLVLLGPPGIYLINALPGRGMYRATGDEWATMAGDRAVMAGLNQIARTAQWTKVLQVYLDRNGYKGVLAVEPILMSADPGMHIESVRPTVRIVMSDALERFAVSMAQAHGTIAPSYASNLARIIVQGAPPKAPAAPPPAPVPASTSAFRDEQPLSSGLGDDDFSFHEEEPAPPPTPAKPPKPAAAKLAARKKKKIMGLSQRQLIILGILLLVGLCSVLAVGIYIFTTLANV